MQSNGHKTRSTVVISDDHPLILSGLRSEIDRLDDYLVVDQLTDGAAALASIKYHKPDIAILDIQMPGLTGLQIAETLSTSGITTRIILLTMHRELSFIQAARRLDVAGYLLKDYVTAEVSDCLDTVASGGYYLSRAIKSIDDETESDASTLEALSRMERKVFRLIGESKTTDEIAKLLFLSPKTVENHRYRISKKLKLEGTKNSLMKFALKHRNGDRR